MNFLTIYYSEGSSKPEVLKLNVAHNPLVSVDGFNLLGENVHTVKKRDKVRFSQHAYLWDYMFQLKNRPQKDDKTVHTKNKETIKYTYDYRQYGKTDEEWNRK